MRTYDVILVLGSQPDYRNWLFPSHTYHSLDKALQLLNHGVAPYIALTGDHALKFDATGITQPFREADQMEDYLLTQGCPPEVIVKEHNSRDTLSNYYFIKKQVLEPRQMYNILQLAPDFRITRLQFIAQKVLGPNYTVTFQRVAYAADETYDKEAFVLQKQQEFLRAMPDGDDAWLKDQFYDSPMYQYWRQRDLAETDPVKRYLI